jgi:hypothetical protein
MIEAKKEVIRLERIAPVLTVVASASILQLHNVGTLYESDYRNKDSSRITDH